MVALRFSALLPAVLITESSALASWGALRYDLNDHGMWEDRALGPSSRPKSVLADGSVLGPGPSLQLRTQSSVRSVPACG